jgi:TP901 family phage tail tape measure protein
MAATIGSVRVQLTANSAEFSAMMARAEKSVNKFSRSFKHIQRRMRVTGRKAERFGSKLTHNLTIPLALAGGASVKLASDFQSSMTQLRTEVGLSVRAVNKMRSGVISLSKDTGESLTDLAHGLKAITSDGLRGAHAMNVLQTSAKLAAENMGNLHDIARSLTSVVNAYGEDVLSASRAGNIFLRILRSGTIQADKLAPALSKVIPIASTLGVSFSEVGANLATLTHIGVPIEKATTYLRGLLNNLTKVTEQQKRELKELTDGTDRTGLTFKKLRKQLKTKGLFSVLKELSQITDNNVSAMSRLFPNIRGLTNVLGTISTQADTYADSLKKIKRRTDDVSDSFRIVSKTTEFKFRKALNDVKVAGEQLGALLLPLANKIAATITKLAEKFEGLSKHTKKLIVKIGLLTAAVGPLLKIGGKLIKMFASLLTPIRKVITLLLKLGKFAVMNVVVGSFRKLTAVLRLVRMKGLIPVIEALGRTVVALLTTAAEIIAVVAVAAGLADAAVAIYQNWDKIKQFFKGVWQKIKQYFYTGAAGVLKAFRFLAKNIPFLGKKISGSLDGAISKLQDLADAAKGSAKVNLHNNVGKAMRKSIVGNAEKAWGFVKAGAAKTMSFIQNLWGKLSFKLPTASGATPSSNTQKNLPIGRVKHIGNLVNLDPSIKQLQTVKASADEAHKSIAQLALGDNYDKIKKGFGKIKDAGERLGQALQYTITNAITNFAETLGNIFTGDMGAGSFFKGILQMVASFAKRLGSVMVAVGAAGIALHHVFANPYAAIAAGTALIALSAVAKNLLKKGPAGDEKSKNSSIPHLAEGGIVPPGFPNDSYPALLTSGEKVIPSAKPLTGMGGRKEKYVQTHIYLDSTEILTAISDGKSKLR